MTSNVGAEYISAGIKLEMDKGTSDDGQGLDAATKEQVMEAVRNHFRPEFLN